MGKINVQEVFNKVIEAGYYAIYEEGKRSSTLMCFALSKAHMDNLITLDERHQAGLAIRDYLPDCGTLEDKLFRNNYPYGFKARRTIYLNWNNRPDLPI